MRFVLMLTALLVLAGCTATLEAPKSPCVGAESSPCARQPVLSWV